MSKISSRAKRNVNANRAGYVLKGTPTRVVSKAPGEGVFKARPLRFTVLRRTKRKGLTNEAVQKERR